MDPSSLRCDVKKCGRDKGATRARCGYVESGKIWGSSYYLCSQCGGVGCLEAFIAAGFRKVQTAPTDRGGTELPAGREKGTRYPMRKSPRAARRNAAGEGCNNLPRNNV